MKPRTFVIVAALIVAIGGLILLSVNVSATADGGKTVACGSGFKTDMSQAAHDQSVGTLTNAMMADEGYTSYLYAGTNVDGYQRACADALSTRRTWGFGLLAIGALALVGGAVVRTTPRPAAKPT